ncbi:MAG: hypothetical protein WDA74_12165 [Spirochaetota bacterium]
MKLKINFYAGILFIIMLFLSCAGIDKDEKAKLNYRNNRHSFALTFPETWKNYVVFEKQDIIAPGFMVDTLYFALPTRARNWQPFNVPDNFAAIFSIRVFSLEVWDDFYKKYRDNSVFFSRSDKVLFRSRDYVYVLKYGVSLPVDLYSYSKDTEPIVSSFLYTGRK